MQGPLQFISEEYGVPVNTFSGAVLSLTDREMEKAAYEDGIAKIIGLSPTPTYSSQAEARVYFLYSVQETIRELNMGHIPDMEQLWKDVQTKAQNYILENPWVLKKFDEAQVTTNESTAPQKYGCKRDQAEALYEELNGGQNSRTDIINAFIDELEMSKAGATTYFHNLRKKHGFEGDSATTTKNGSTVTTTKGPSKGKIAEDIYATMKGGEKQDIINEIIKQTGTSKAGANTYYCAARKKLESN